MPFRRAKIRSDAPLLHPSPPLPFAAVNAALIPVRSIAGAKQRLASCLSLARRETLALAMLEDMLSALRGAESLDRIVVVSSDADLLAHASRCGAEALAEGDARGLNGAVAMAAAHLEAQGVRRLLTIPGDVPLLDPLDVDGLFATDPARYPVVAAPSFSAAGTNGLLTSPPTVIDFVFEGDSLSAYRRECRGRGVQMLILALESFAVDIDTPSDLLSLPARAGHRTCTLVEEWRDDIAALAALEHAAGARGGSA